MTAMDTRGVVSANTEAQLRNKTWPRACQVARARAQQGVVHLHRDRAAFGAAGQGPHLVGGESGRGAYNEPSMRPLLAAGAPRPMKMGTIASPWRYNAEARRMLRPLKLRRFAISHCALRGSCFESERYAGSCLTRGCRHQQQSALL